MDLGFPKTQTHPVLPVLTLFLILTLS